MASDISSKTRVYCVALDRGKRSWLVKYGDIKRDSRVLAWPFWSDFASDAKPMAYDFAVIFKERMWTDHKNEILFTLSASDDAPFIETHKSESLVEDDRVPMSYRSLMIRPFVATDARKMWLCRLSDPDTGQMEPVKGNGIEEVADAVIERGLFAKAEKAPTPPKELTVVPNHTGPVTRRRPGDL